MNSNEMQTARHVPKSGDGSMDRNDRMKLGRLFGVTTLAVAVVATVAVAVPAVEAGQTQNPMYPPNSHPHGSTYGEWGAVWWTWAGQFPFAENPIADEGPDIVYGDANEQPDGAVWYLAGHFFFMESVERNLNVPAGKSLLFPLINQVAVSPEDCWYFGLSMNPDPCTAEELLGVTEEFLTEDVSDISVWVDGVEVGNPFAYRATSEPFTLEVEPGTLWTDGGLAPGSHYPTISDGYYMMLKPFTPGEHILHFEVLVDGQMTENVTYHLTVG